MANRKNSNNNRSNSGWLSLFSFVAIMLLGLALMLAFIFDALKVNESISTWIERIALAIAMIVPAVMSYREARKKTTVWFVLWVIAVVLVVVFYILGIVL